MGEKPISRGVVFHCAAHAAVSRSSLSRTPTQQLPYSPRRRAYSRGSMNGAGHAMILLTLQECRLARLNRAAETPQQRRSDAPREVKHSCSPSTDAGGVGVAFDEGHGATFSVIMLVKPAVLPSPSNQWKLLFRASLPASDSLGLVDVHSKALSTATHFRLYGAILRFTGLNCGLCGLHGASPL